MVKKSAVEMILYNPHLGLVPDGYGGHENLWIKERFDQNYVSIGFFVKDSSEIQYFMFNERNKPINEIKFYSSLAELAQNIPHVEDIFENTPYLFVMGHNGDGKYRLGGAHLDVGKYDESEQIYGRNIDKLINHFVQALPHHHKEILVTIEACNAADLTAARQAEEAELSIEGIEESKRRELEAQTKSFVERLSDNFPQMTFSGTAPWSPEERDTGSRASGGYPKLNIPITSMGGNIWKSGYNTVAFYANDLQIVVRKSPLASTDSAKNLKLNTIEYANKILQSLTNKVEREKILKEICADPTILKIGDLDNTPYLPKKFIDDSLKKIEKTETEILDKEKSDYIEKVQTILAKSKEEFSPRDLLIIALGLNHSEVFNENEALKEEILTNRKLLDLLIVTSGKVLIGKPDNNQLIETLISRGANINSTDEQGMTALHYAVSNFYNYRKEPLDLIEKLLEKGANIGANNNVDETPQTIALKRDKVDDQSRKKLLATLESRPAATHQDKPTFDTGSTPVSSQSIFSQPQESGTKLNEDSSTKIWVQRPKGG